MLGFDEEGHVSFGGGGEVFEVGDDLIGIVLFACVEESHEHGVAIAFGDLVEECSQDVRHRGTT